MDTFQHIPLGQSRECIRLLRFVDQPRSPGLGHFALETYDVATAPRFVALSYTWGSPGQSHNIIVNGSLLSIRENLWVALQALRRFFSSKSRTRRHRLNRPWRWTDTGISGFPLMWIDAICINQSNHLEKNHQVNMMGRIFTAARCVISWLGDEADGSRRVMRAIRATMETRQYDFELKQAMDAFVKRPYWRRMWVIQEFVLPQDLVILCGREGAWWEDLFHFWCDEKFARVADGGYRDFSGKTLQSVGEGGLPALISVRRSRREELLELFPVHRIMTGFTYGECSDPRDRIYALLALIKPRAGVEPLLADYEISTEVLYYRVLGYVGPLKQSRSWRKFRRELREALGSSSWAGAEAAKLHEVVYEIVGMDYTHEGSVELAVTKEERGLFSRVQERLSKHLGQYFDGVFCGGDWIYHDIIRRFRTFPRDEDPGTWRRFDNLLLRWLQVLPTSSCSIFCDDLSNCELGMGV